MLPGVWRAGGRCGWEKREWEGLEVTGRRSCRGRYVVGPVGRGDARAVSGSRSCPVQRKVMVPSSDQSGRFA